MIPIPGLDNVRCNWITIEAEGFQLHGFLLYTASDHFFPEYIDGEGLGDLDIWTGNECAIFIVHSPSQQWIDYTRTTDHVWWKLFGQTNDTHYLQNKIITEYGNSPILVIDGERRTMRQLFSPTLNQFLHGDEIERILSWFDLGSTQHPSLILFKNLRDRTVWYVDMGDMIDIPERDLRRSLQLWFGGKEFKRILKEARNA